MFSGVYFKIDFDGGFVMDDGLTGDEPKCCDAGELSILSENDTPFLIGDDTGDFPIWCIML